MQPGGEAVITRLADILVIQAVRAWIQTAPAPDGLARSASGSADRAGDHADPPRSGPPLDG